MLVAADDLMGSLSLLYPVAMRLHGAKQNQVRVPTFVVTVVT